MAGGQREIGKERVSKRETLEASEVCYLLGTPALLNREEDYPPLSCGFTGPPLLILLLPSLDCMGTGTQ